MRLPSPRQASAEPASTSGFRRQARTGPPTFRLTPDAVIVGAAETTTSVALVQETIVVPAGSDPPAITRPTSLRVKFAVAEVTVVLLTVSTPSVARAAGCRYWMIAWSIATCSFLTMSSMVWKSPVGPAVSESSTTGTRLSLTSSVNSILSVVTGTGGTLGGGVAQGLPVPGWWLDHSWGSTR